MRLRGRLRQRKCVDGVCCDTDCNGTCQACNVPGSLGTCSNMPIGQTDTTCNGLKACDGASGCKTAAGFGCGSDDACASGVCFGSLPRSDQRRLHGRSRVRKRAMLGFGMHRLHHGQSVQVLDVRRIHLQAAGRRSCEETATVLAASARPTSACSTTTLLAASTPIATAVIATAACACRAATTVTARGMQPAATHTLAQTPAERPSGAYCVTDLQCAAASGVQMRWLPRQVPVT